MPLSILHVAQPTDHGVARCVAALAADQVRRGWRVSVACPREGWLAEEVRRVGAVHHDWPAVRAPQSGLVREMRTLRAAVAASAPEVVHLHSAKAGLSGRLVLRGKRPTVFQPHAWSFLALGGAPRRLAAAWERFSSRWTTTVVCCSRDEERRGRDIGVRAASVVVPNAVDLDRFRPADAAERMQLRETAGVAPDASVAVCVGRLSPQKGQDLLVAAWPAVREQCPEAQLLLVGDGPDRPLLEARAGEGIRFLGEQREVRAWLALADVAVLPSRYEGMALGVLEAMACGRAVVAADADGMREALGSGAEAGGAVVAVGDVAALAGAVSQRLRDRTLADAEGRFGRSRAEANHDRRSWAGALAAVALAARDRGARR
jgi:glycosyltransferase involved in cell wall biosynthesis